MFCASKAGLGRHAQESVAWLAGLSMSFRISKSCRLLTLWSIVCIGAGAQQPSAAQQGFFKGRMLVAACDTDMLPSAYLGGPLGPEVGPDQLAVIRLDRPLASERAATVSVTNSVVGPPASVVVTPDGRYAIVIETKGPRPAGATKLSELPSGRAITVIELADPDNPHVVQKVEGFDNPLSLSINQSGNRIVVTYAPSDQPGVPPLAFYRVRDGRLSQPMTPAIPGYVRTDKLTSAHFHPVTDTIAVVYASPSKLTLLQVNDQNSTLSLSGLGNDVPLDQSSFTAIFTPDGQFVLVNAMLPFVRGSVSSIRVGAASAPAEKPDGKLHNYLVSRVQTGLFPEGLAVSPDGRWAVTSNLENSTFPLDDPRQGFFSSLSLIRIDPATGTLMRVGDFPFDGMLPEAPVFDDSSRFLAVTNFSQYRDPKGGGSIDFWRLAEDAFTPGRVELVKMVQSVAVPRGPQSMAIVRAK